MKFVVAGIFAFGATAIAADQTLVSTRANSPIVLDGMADKAWDGAEAKEVTLDNLPCQPDNGYEGIEETDVSIKSLYDDNFVYFLITYKDPTKSLERFPWVKQEDGSWKKAGWLFGPFPPESFKAVPSLKKCADHSNVFHIVPFESPPRTQVRALAWFGYVFDTMVSDHGNWTIMVTDFSCCGASATASGDETEPPAFQTIPASSTVAAHRLQSNCARG